MVVDSNETYLRQEGVELPARNTLAPGVPMVGSAAAMVTHLVRHHKVVAVAETIDRTAGH